PRRRKRFLAFPRAPARPRQVGLLRLLRISHGLYLRHVPSVRKAHPVALATLGFVLLTLAYSWPLPRHVLHGVAHDPGDPLLNAWILWWSTKAVPLTSAWWNAPMFSPALGTFAFSEHLLGEAPIAWPIIALTGNALFGYNVALLASYVLCGLGAYFLA